MTNCSFCGKQEVQQYTFDNLFTCNECMGNPDNFMDSNDDGNIIYIDSNGKKIILNENESIEMTVEHDAAVLSLSHQFDFLRRQLEEKDNLIRELILIIKQIEMKKCESIISIDKPMLSNNTSLSLNRTFTFANSNEFINSTPAPQTPVSLSSSSYTYSSNSDEYVISDEVFIDDNDTSIRINKNEKKINNFTNFTKVFRMKEKSKESLRNQMKDIRHLHHVQYCENKKTTILTNELYSNISDSSIPSADDFINKAAIENREKAKAALAKLAQKEIHPRYRVPNQSFPWSNGTTLVIGDSILQGLEEYKLKRYNMKIRSFPGCVVDDLYDYVKPLLKKNPTNIIIHCGTNDSSAKSSGQIINELTNLKNFIEEKAPGINVIFSSPTLRVDNLILNNKLLAVSKYLAENFTFLVLSRNIDRSCLGKKGLHLNPKGSGRLASNLIALVKRL